jgi:hypothetical protein
VVAPGWRCRAMNRELVIGWRALGVVEWRIAWGECVKTSVRVTDDTPQFLRSPRGQSGRIKGFQRPSLTRPSPFPDHSLMVKRI